MALPRLTDRHDMVEGMIKQYLFLSAFFNG
jgi:hypothetical protein